MRYRDMVDANNVEYNNPYARSRIRQYNSGKNDLGKYWDQKFKLADFCIDTLPRFFPLINGIWADSFHFAHLSILELTRVACEYGFVKADDCARLIKAIVQCTQSLKKLQDAWNEKAERDEDEFKEEMRTMTIKEMFKDDVSVQSPSSPDRSLTAGTLLLAGSISKEEDMRKLSAKAKMKLAMKSQKDENAWMKSEKHRKLTQRLQQVADIIAKCKEHIAQITVHVITLMYDDTLLTLYPSYVYKHMSFVSLEAEKERLKFDIDNNFLFYDANFKNSLLEITYTYLSEIHYLENIRIRAPATKASVEKLFMYVSTAERDCFLNSMRMVTSSDTKWFEANVAEKPSVTQHIFMIRNSMIMLLDHMACGGFNKYGVIVKPVGDNDENFHLPNLWNNKFKKKQDGLFGSFNAHSRELHKTQDGEQAIKVGDNIFDLINILIQDMKG